MQFKPNETKMDMPATSLERVMLINKSFVYYLHIASIVQDSLRSLTKDFQVNPNDISNQEADKKGLLFIYSNLAYPFDGDRLLWNRKTKKIWDQFPYGSRLPVKEYTNEDVIDIIIAARELDTFFFSYVERIYSIGTTDTRKFQNYNSIMEEFIFEQKL